MNSYNPLDDLLEEFSTVTLVPVIYGSRTQYELRLYIPNRVEYKTMTIYMETARRVFNLVAVVNFTVETNQSRRICFNGFVEPTERLRTAVNEIRKKRGLKPCLA